MTQPFATAARAAFFSAVLAAAGLIAFQSPASAADEKKPTVSKDLAKPLKAAQDALTAKKYADALVKLKEAEGNPKKTPYDQHIINELSGFAYVRLNNYPEAVKSLEAGLNDGFLDQGDVANRVKTLAQVNYQLKNYDKAIEFGNRAIKAGNADEEMMTLVGQAYYLKGDWKGTQRFEDNLIEQQIKGGRTPKTETLQIALSACVKLNDTDCTTRELERLVAYYPKTEYWAQLLASLHNEKQTSDRATMQLYRLMLEVDVLKEPNDFNEMAQLAIEQGSPGEAQHVLEKGFEKNVFTDARQQDKNKRLLETAKKAATTDLANLAKVQQDADAATTGDKNVGVGLAYLGYQQYDKAADNLSKGLGKGGVKNEAEARLLLGIAQLKAGRKEEAVKSFKAVKGDPNLERLANLWTLHAKQA
ncbi:MAG TPA: tetratricopeptide repeat protein [Steroidobacteraceae bacterium]|nr:tetratricopeptide repeat protein [Steroidobacteraceae bacterium]